MENPYFTNKDIEIERIKMDLENETEDCMKNAIQSILSMLYELTKKNSQKVYKVPTDNREDIIVGLHKQGLISYKDKHEALLYIAKKKGCNNCNCGDEFESNPICKRDEEHCKCGDKDSEEPKIRRLTEGAESKEATEARD